MHLDDTVCYCFHVTRRKLMNFCRLRRPRVPSLLSECGGAGTGCGWCVPFLKMIFRHWQSGECVPELEEISAQEYARRRSDYIRSGHGKPPPSAKSSAEQTGLDGLSVQHSDDAGAGCGTDADSKGTSSSASGI
jgi:bacterioferritin-associated ferredoxin